MGALTVIGGYTEVLCWRAGRLIPVPAALDPVQAAPLILNYNLDWIKTMERTQDKDNL